MYFCFQHKAYSKPENRYKAWKLEYNVWKKYVYIAPTFKYFF